MREIFSALVHDQKSIGQIVRDLNTRQVPTRRGAPRWDRSTVCAILLNPAYMGKAVFGKTESVERNKVLRPIRNKAVTPRHAKSAHRNKPPEEWISMTCRRSWVATFSMRPSWSLNATSNSRRAMHEESDIYCKASRFARPADTRSVGRPCQRPQPRAALAMPTTAVSEPMRTDSLAVACVTTRKFALISWMDRCGSRFASCCRTQHACSTSGRVGRRTTERPQS